MGLTQYATVEFVTETCCTCGILFCVTKELQQRKLKNREHPEKRFFYCPEGHAQFFLGKNEVTELQEELKREQKRRQWAENGLNASKSLISRFKNRIKNGICPCCNRSFQDLHRHMQTKHPDWNKGK